MDILKIILILKISRHKCHASIRSSYESSLFSPWKHQLAQGFHMQGLFLNKWIVLPTSWDTFCWRWILHLILCDN